MPAPTPPAVTLRDAVADDLPILYEHQRDPEAAAMAAFPMREWDAFAAHWARIGADPAVINKVIEADGAVAGSIGSFEQDGKRLVGYWVGREHWGRGIATGALAAFLALDPTRPLYAYVAAHNIASRRVLEKCGFTIVGREVAADGVEELLLVLPDGGATPPDGR